MKYYYTDQKVLLRKNMKLAQIVKKLPNGNYLAAFYEDNKLKYDVIVSENDVIDEDEYEIIRKRINTINKLLDS
jgi:hypothetical protein